MNNFWFSESQRDIMEKYLSNRYNRIFFSPNEIYTKKESDNVKLAWVIISEERKIIGVDNLNYKGYKLNETTPSIKLPLEEIGYDKFCRWCTTFDT